MEVYESVSQSLMFNISKTSPDFMFDVKSTDVMLFVSLYSANKMGRSTAKLININFTQKPQTKEKRISKSYSETTNQREKDKLI